jgi:hypothetical protein
MGCFRNAFRSSLSLIRAKEKKSRKSFRLSAPIHSPYATNLTMEAKSTNGVDACFLFGATTTMVYHLGLEIDGMISSSCDLEYPKQLEWGKSLRYNSKRQKLF